jgi:hypothetical protein
MYMGLDAIVLALGYGIPIVGFAAIGASSGIVLTVNNIRNPDNSIAYKVIASTLQTVSLTGAGAIVGAFTGAIIVGSNYKSPPTSTHQGDAKANKN